MSTIADNLSRIQQAKADIKTAIEAKGVTVPSSATIDTYDDYVSQISGGGGIEMPSKLDNATFNNYGMITSATIKSGETSIGSEAFYNCSSLTSVTIPNSVTSIGDYTFGGCEHLKSCTIGSGLTSIGNYAFQSCSRLTSVTIPDSVTAIGQYAFNGCTRLTSCTIGSGVTSIGNDAFYYCTSLTSITINATTPPTLGNSVFSNTNNCPIYVPSESLSTYQSAWSDYASRIQSIPNS